VWMKQNTQPKQRSNLCVRVPETGGKVGISSSKLRAEQNCLSDEYFLQ
jgi:hypothetical protein